MTIRHPGRGLTVARRALIVRCAPAPSRRLGLPLRLPLELLASRGHQPDNRVERKKTTGLRGLGALGECEARQVLRTVGAVGARQRSDDDREQAHDHRRDPGGAHSAQACQQSDLGGALHDEDSLRLTEFSFWGFPPREDRQQRANAYPAPKCPDVDLDLNFRLRDPVLPGP
jgi:hypothetical protein